MNDIADHQLDQLSRYILEHTGLHFPEKKWQTLSKGMKTAAARLDYEIGEFIDLFMTSPPSPELLDTVIGHLTVGETYFLRDKNFFQILKDHIFRGLVQNPRRGIEKLIFWSAGCATGEEPYSIAILIDHALPRLRRWDITIIGSDINPESLKKAEKGIYTPWSLRETPDEIIEKYFTPLSGNRFELSPRIRSMVRFTQLNLADRDLGARLNCAEPVDIILCRNVLMYFDAHSRDHVLGSLAQMLVANGWLITGPAESGFVKTPGLTPVRFPNAIFYRKGMPRSRERDDAQDVRPPEMTLRPPDTRSDRKKSHTNIRRITDTQNETRPAVEIFQDALAAYERGTYAGCVDLLTPLLSNQATADKAFLMKTQSMTLLAKAHANLGDLGCARKWCAKALASEKLNPEIYYLMATLFQASGETASAIRAVKQSLYLDPEFIMAHFLLGLLMQKEKRLAENRRSFQNALALLQSRDPDDILPHSEGLTSRRLMETIKNMIN